MLRHLNKLAIVTAAAVALCLMPSGLAAQGKSKHYAVTSDKALSVTQEVLVKQGFEVVRVSVEGDNQVVYYRRGNNGKGKGKGALEKMVIRHEANRVVFVDTPDAILLDIDVRLRL